MNSGITGLRTTLLCFLLCAASGPYALGGPSDWWWFAPTTTSTLKTAVIGPDLTVMAIGSTTVYRGHLGDTAFPVLDQQEFKALGSEPRLTRMADGTVFLSGSEISMTTAGFYRFETLSSDPERLDAEALDGTTYDGDIGADGLLVLDNHTVAFRCTYSYNSGRNWYRMKNATEAGVHERHVQRIGDSIYALNVRTRTWYVVDTTRREFAPSSFDGNYCRFALLSSGAGLAIRHGAGDEIELRYRSAGAAEWSPLPLLTDDNGVVVDASRSIYSRSMNLLTTRTDKAVFFLDSARVLEFNGVTFVIRTLSNDLSSSSIVRPATLVRGDSVVQLVYELHRPETAIRRTYHIVEYSLTNGSVSVINAGRWIPYDISEQRALYTGPTFRASGSEYLRPAFRAVSHEGKLADQPKVVQVGRAGDVIFCVSDDGIVHGIDPDSSMPARLQVSTGASYGEIESRRVTRRNTILGRENGTVLVPGTVVSTGGYSESSYDWLPTIASGGTATCAAYDNMGTLFIGHRELVWWDDSAWVPLPIPTAIRDSGITFSGILHAEPSTIFVSLRAYGVGSSTEDNFTMKRGGIARSDDGGATWASVPLPRGEQWVESLTVGPDGHLYCWATTMVMDTAYGRLPQDPRPRHGSARLYRSSDRGDTWEVLYTDEVDEQERRIAVVHQWSISFSSTGAIAINTPFEVLTAQKVGEAFTPVLDLPPAAGIGGVVFDQAGDLWIGTSYGLHRRSLNPSSISADETASQLSEALYALHAQPNPVTDNVVFTLTSSLSAASLPDFITLSSINGATTVRIPRSGSVYELSSVALTAGVYTASAHVGTTVVSTMIVIL